MYLGGFTVCGLELHRRMYGRIQRRTVQGVDKDDRPDLVVKTPGIGTICTQGYQYQEIHGP
jgi:hypothetical protein